MSMLPERERRWLPRERWGPPAESRPDAWLLCTSAQARRGACPCVLQWQNHWTPTYIKTTEYLNKEASITNPGKREEFYPCKSTQVYQSEYVGTAELSVRSRGPSMVICGQTFQESNNLPGQWRQNGQTLNPEHRPGAGFFSKHLWSAILIARTYQKVLLVVVRTYQRVTWLELTRRFCW